MKERPIDQITRDMCQQCFYRGDNNKCLDGASVRKQIERARFRVCRRAAIQDGAFDSEDKFHMVLGNMIQADKGVWVFEWRDYPPRSDETGNTKSTISVGEMCNGK